MNKRVFLAGFLLLVFVLLIGFVIFAIVEKKQNKYSNIYNLENEQSSEDNKTDNKDKYGKVDNTIKQENCNGISEIMNIVGESAAVISTSNKAEEVASDSISNQNFDSYDSSNENTQASGDKTGNDLSNNLNEQGSGNESTRENISPGWIYYSSKGGNGLSSEQKAYLDSVISQWTNGSITSASVENTFAQKIAGEWNLQISGVGVSGNQICLYSSKADIPNFNSIVSSRSGTYNFIGLYTKGEYDECGNLICYYWEAGVM